MEAMETDAATSGRGAAEDAAPPAAAAATRGEAPGDAWRLLAMARQFIDQGKPSLALQAVVTAMKSQGGEEAVHQTLHRARELYRNKLQANSAVDELASLFAECAIAEAQPIRPDTQPHRAVGPSLLSDASETSILAMTGRKQIMLDAFADGSSFICLRCGGLVSIQRRQEHLDFWCV